jgi:hypothetical protein
MRSGSIALPSANLPRTQGFKGSYERPPGVNTCLSVRECRVYGHTLQWIEYFILLCRLVPMCAPNTQFLYVTPYLCGTLPQQGGFLPKHRYRYPVAIPYHYALRLHLAGPKTCQMSENHGTFDSLLRTCAVPGTHKLIHRNLLTAAPLLNPVIIALFFLMINIEEND